MDNIHCLPVMLWMTVADRFLITSHKRSITFSNVWKASFLNPRLRISSQICSIGFISGVYGGMKARVSVLESPRKPTCATSLHHTPTGFDLQDMPWPAHPGIHSCSLYCSMGEPEKNLLHSSVPPLHKHIDIHECDDMERTASFLSCTSSSSVC